uniref:Death domain-containing protein n=1 Tax=Amphimedon queenslandica TaxID=400682 RepID=A0A1X7TJT7_AMPQE
MATKSSNYSSSPSLFSSPLTIDQLIDVLDLLKRCGFPQTRWHELGLTLGLHKNTLDAIKKDSDTTYDCLTECLSKWLSRADNVDSKGGATFDSLSDALKSMNENAAADKLDQEKCKAKAIDIFNTHHPLLSQSLSDPVSVAIMLQREGVITGQAKLENCLVLPDVLDVVKGECSLTDISLLEAIVEEFEVAEAERYIEQYKTTLEGFCQSMSIDLCLKEKFDAVNTSPSLKCESATYVFDWRPDEKKLKDITDILSKTSGKFVKIKYIDTGYSIVVTCSFPHSLTGALVIKLSENLELLIKNGLIKLTVGYYTIWKKQKIQEIQEPLEEEVQEIKRQPHDTKRQKELKETANQLTKMLSEKEKELKKMKEKIQELSLIKETKVSDK